MGISLIDGIIRPDGNFVVDAAKGATPNIRTVSPSEFARIKGLVLDGANSAGSYANGKGTWYSLPDGGRIGPRTSDKNGTTLDIDVPGIPRDLKIHQDDS